MFQEHYPPAVADPLAHAAFGARLTTSILEHFDHGILLLTADCRVLHANLVAQRECALQAAFRLEQGRLVAIRRGDTDRLMRALADAARGLRTMLHFDADERCLPLVVLPLSMSSASVEGKRGNGGLIDITLVLLAKRSGTEPLNFELFAQASGLTMAERTVLKGLSLGRDPTELAQAIGVALTTVRSQILSIRQKTRTGSIREPHNVVNNLPPVVCASETRA